MSSAGGCPLGYDRKAASAAEKHEAKVARRVDGLLFDAVEREAARQMDTCRTRVAVASKFVRGLWVLGISHELLPCGRGHCAPEAHESRLAEARAGTVRDAIATRCDRAGLRDRLSHCSSGEQGTVCVEKQLDVFVRCATRVIAASVPPSTSLSQ
eukprot:COSAG02_NODE_14_length_56855_cov_512.793661_23_plen_155_part_00